MVLVRRYPYVVATLLVGAVGVILVLAGIPWASWVPALFVVGMAVRSTVGIVREVRQRRFGVDILAVVAIGASVAVGEVWAALVIVLMLTGGEALEDFAANRAKRDLTALLDRAPRTAHRVDGDAVTDVPIDEIVPGERVLVRPGEIVPVDGSLESASGVFDESSLTGESLPVERAAGQEVLSGGVNGSAAVVVRALRAASDSQYRQIIALVERASASRSPIVRLADRFAVPYTAFALALATVAALLAREPVRFAEVLVVATPCPLIIAAPIAFLAGMSRAARVGVIIKESGTLETLSRCRTVAFDKTGTLTEGRPALVDVRPVSPWAPDDLLLLAASAERSSAHVLAQAMTAAAEERGLRLGAAVDAVETTGNGVVARVDGHAVAVGKRASIASIVGRAIERTPLSPDELAVYVAIDGRAAGAVVFRDRVRPDARRTIERTVSRRGRTVIMLTGDDRPTAEHVAQQLGIVDVRANCLPVDKVAAVSSVRERPVVMVGDGVNDAPVLAAADVGIAMGARGSTAASDAADVVLLRDDIASVGRTLEIGASTVRIARQSIGVGIALSVVLMGVAAAGLLPALAGAWLQEAVDVVSILWAVRAVRERGSIEGDLGRSSTEDRG